MSQAHAAGKRSEVGIRPAALALAMVGIMLLAACRSTGSQPDAVEPSCESGEDQAGLISERLAHGADELHDAKLVRLDPPVGQYAYVVAAEVEGEIGVWGVGPWLGGARVLSVDDVAQRWSTWGTAIPDDSPAGRQRAELARRPEVATVRACVE